MKINTRGPAENAGLIFPLNKMQKMKNRDENKERFESYPKPSEADNQLKNQPEFIDELGDETKEQEINDRPSTGNVHPRPNTTSDEGRK